MRHFPFVFALACLAAGAASAQVDLVDPDAKNIVRERAPVARPAPLPTVVPAAEAPRPHEAPHLAAPPTRPAPVAHPEARPDAGVSPPAAVAPPVTPPTPERGVSALKVIALSDADLDVLYGTWNRASVANDIKAEQAARAELLKVHRQVGASDMDLWAIGLLRAAARAETAGDSGAAVEMALTASQLAPHLPAAWVGLASAYFRADPSEAGRYLSAMKSAVALQFGDPRYARPVMVDWGATLVVTIMGLAIAVMSVLAVRRGRYFLHDFHYLFPSSASRWQTGALALLLVALPVVFRLGLVPALLAVFLALTLYLSLKERALAVVLIGLLGLVPFLGRALVSHASFAGTPAERAYLVDRAGPGAERPALELKALAAEDKASFAELYALGRFELRRGRFEDAVAHLKLAQAQRPDDPRVQTNLAVALFLMGDLENGRPLLESATKADPELAIAWHDLGRLFQRRQRVKGDIAAGEVNRATASFSEARQRDPALDGLKAGEDVDALTGNELVRTVPLPTAELLTLAQADAPAERVRSQLATMMTGEVGDLAGLLYPWLLALLVAGFGQLSRTIDAARVCNKCGRPVSRRADPDVSAGSPMCTQCVNVFAKKNVVAPSLKVRKQLEVARYQSQLDRVSYVLGVAFSGMGHVFAGAPLRGTIYGFFFLSAVVGFVFRNGVTRAPFDPIPASIRLLPFLVIFVVVYLGSLTGLRKKQG